MVTGKTCTGQGRACKRGWEFQVRHVYVFCVHGTVSAGIDSIDFMILPIAIHVRYMYCTIL